MCISTSDYIQPLKECDGTLEADPLARNAQHSGNHYIHKVSLVIIIVVLCDCNCIRFSGGIMCINHSYRVIYSVSIFSFLFCQVQPVQMLSPLKMNLKV